MELSLPVVFIFIFATTFGALHMAGLFERRVNALIALALAIAAISQSWIVSSIYSILPIVTIFILAVFAVKFFKTIFLGSKEEIQNEAPALIVSLGLLLIVLGNVADKLVQLLPVYVPTMDFLWLVGVLVVALMFYLAWKSQSQQAQQVQPSS